MPPRKTDKPDRVQLISEHTERLFVMLSAEEYDTRAQQLAQVQYDLQDHYAEEDALKKQLKAKESKLEERRAELSSAVRLRKEPRDVLVQAFAHYDEGKFREVRADSGEVVSERDLRPEERQAPIPFPKTGPQKLTPEQQKEAERRRLEEKADEILAGDYARDEQRPDQP